jgi:hypothetical protein
MATLLIQARYSGADFKGMVTKASDARRRPRPWRCATLAVSVSVSAGGGGA